MVFSVSYRSIFNVKRPLGVALDGALIESSYRSLQIPIVTSLSKCMDASACWFLEAWELRVMLNLGFRDCVGFGSVFLGFRFWGFELFNYLLWV